MAQTKIQNFIDGQFQDPVNGKWFEKIDPATGKLAYYVPDSDTKDIEAAVEAAKRAFPLWSKTPRQKRAEFLNKIADAIEKHLEEFAQEEARDTGKGITFARNVDIPRAVLNFRFFAGAILHHEELSTEIDNTAINYTVRQPIGVCGLISPWNLPIYLLSWKVAPAIAVGNTVVCKPSEMTSLTALHMCKIMQEICLPNGVVNVVCGLGPRAGQALVAHPDVSLISFTGGTKTAETIIKTSAPHYKKLSLELGGKNPNIIFDDCNLEDCIETTLRSSFANQGEICLCGSRIYVQEGIYEKFMEKFVERVKKIKVGPPLDPSTFMGALITKDHFDKVWSYIELARAEGANIVTGGSKLKMEGELEGGFWLEPTVITGIKQTSRCAQEEIFGPVVTVSTFKTEEEAIALANDVKYGLCATIWTENVRRAHRVALGIQAGTVWVNCWLLRDLRVPFGGMKHSGIGREGGNFSIDCYTEQKTICMKYV